MAISSMIWGTPEGIVVSNARGDKLKVVGIYVNKDTGTIVIEYDDTPKGGE